MANTSVAVLKFVGTISLGLLTGMSTTLSTIALPALLTLPTATTARATHTYLSSKSRLLTSYLRHLTTFALFSAYLLSPRRLRHPYLLYTCMCAWAAGPGVDYAVEWRETEAEREERERDEFGPDFEGGLEEARREVDLEAFGEGLNGEGVRRRVEAQRKIEGARAGILGVAFAVGVVGIWGDGA